MIPVDLPEGRGPTSAIAASICTDATARWNVTYPRNFALSCVVENRMSSTTPHNDCKYKLRAATRGQIDVYISVNPHSCGNNAYSNGGWVDLYIWQSLSLAHEIGHEMGRAHAGQLNCTADYPASLVMPHGCASGPQNGQPTVTCKNLTGKDGKPTTCTWSEYSFTLMGSGDMPLPPSQARALGIDDGVPVVIQKILGGRQAVWFYDSKAEVTGAGPGPFYTELYFVNVEKIKKWLNEP
jgi:hypothetical protein